MSTPPSPTSPRHRWGFKHMGAHGQIMDIVEGKDFAEAEATFRERNPDVRKWTVKRIHPNDWLDKV